MAMIVAVIVTYEPDPEKLSALLSVLAPQVNSIVIVDNGSGRGLRDDPIASDAGVIELIELKSNLGIATAQNIGIARAKEVGANFVLLSDQDSIPQDTMVSKLLTAIIKKEESGALVACVGPRYLDKRRTNLPLPFIQIRGLRLKRGVCISQDSILPVDYLIASGCLKIGRARVGKECA